MTMRLMTFRSAFALTLVAAFAAALSPVQAQAPAPVRIRLGTLAPQGSSYHRILQQMGERWRAETNGRVQVTIYAGTMGSEAELVRRMRAGQLQAAVLTTTGIWSIDPGVAALNQMPMMFRNLDEVDYVKEKLDPLLDKRLGEKGFKELFWADAGWVRFFTRERIDRPDAFKRMKMFVTAGETQQFDLMKSAGYQPVALEWSDALTSLQTKMIDALPTIPYFALTAQLYTIADYMLDLNWAPVVGGLIISDKTWQSMPPDVQQAVVKAAQVSGREFQARGRQESNEAVAAMQKRGLSVVPIPPAAEAEWRRMCEDLYPRIRGSMVPAETFDEVVRLLAEYRAKRPTR